MIRRVPQRSSPKKIVLVAEDEPDILRMVKTFLELEGYSVVEARNGEQAVEAAMRERPDLILMDLNMPRLDGFGAAKRIRQHPALREVPILANSAYGKFGMNFSLREDELKPGFTFYFTKPINFDELRELLNRLLDGS
ncbi:MAG TPA: response regulator [Pyrinomonadaceae bacterium]|nr:response regulator [Pyrinomonadaceae bacterium]